MDDETRQTADLLLNEDEEADEEEIRAWNEARERRKRRIAKAYGIGRDGEPFTEEEEDKLEALMLICRL